MYSRLRYVYRAYRYRYRVDPAELRFVQSCLRLGQVAVDVGCHKGAYTYWMRRHVGPAGEVFAFEPQARLVAYLRELFDAMEYDNVTLMSMGLSDRVGHLPLYVPRTNGTTHESTLEPRNQERGARSEDKSSPRCSHIARRPLLVDVTTLDTFFAEQPRGPDFLKIDVEGHELAVLAGGRKTLEMYRPTLLIECEARHRPDGDVRPVFNFLDSLGYEGWFFENGRRHQLADFDQSAHQPTDRNGVRASRRYVNNFAFKHRASTCGTIAF
jgi:FkbM family methyltransferase